MHSNNWIFEEVVLDELQLFILEVISVVMTGQAVDNVVSLLDATLDEKEHVEADIEDRSDRANLMVFKLVLSEPKVGYGRLIILLALLYAEIIYFHVNSVS